MTWTERLRDLFRGRPLWINALMLFCAYMTFIYMPFDLFYKPVAEDEEVWFGVMLHGWAAKATEPLHWAIYGAGCYGFYYMRPWLHPWAALYVIQVAIGMVVWPVLYRDAALAAALLVGVPFAALGIMLLRAKPLFNGKVQVALPGEATSEQRTAPETPDFEPEEKGKTDG